MGRERRTGRREAGRREAARTVRAPGQGAEEAQDEVALAPRPVVGWQRWDRILFLHWPVEPAELRPLVDRRLELDLHGGSAWVSLTPFTVRGGRLRFLPHLPTLTEFHELNLRTYVRAAGVPGLWFLSLDAASAPACAVARATLGLPYFHARMRRAVAEGRHEFRSARLPPGSPASFAARWSAGAPVPAPPGSLDRFLAERYALYSTLAGRLLRLRVRHRPWALQEAFVDGLEQTVTRAAGIPALDGAPAAAARCSTGVDVAVLAPELPAAG